MAVPVKVQTGTEAVTEAAVLPVHSCRRGWYLALPLHSRRRGGRRRIPLPGALLARGGDARGLDVGAAGLAELLRGLAGGRLGGGGGGSLFLLLLGLLALLLLDVAADANRQSAANSDRLIWGLTASVSGRTSRR